MKGDGRLGKENITKDDTIVPRVQLVQAVSPEVERGLADSGDFFHTLLEESLGNMVEMIVLHVSKRYILWKPRHQGGGILARASDGVNWDIPNLSFEVAPYKDFPKKLVKWETGTKVGKEIGLGKWGTMDPENAESPPAATLSYNLLCVIPGRLDIGPFVFILQRSAEPVAKRLLSQVELLKNVPIFGQKWMVTGKSETRNGNTFNVPHFAKNGLVDDAGLYHELKGLYEFFAVSGVKFDDTAIEPEEDEIVGAAPSGDKTASGDDKY
jgi:hypothetical protein